MRHTVSDPGLLVLSTVFYCGGAETGAHMPAADGRAAGYIAAWRPSSASPDAAAFARRVVTAAAPAGRDRAKSLLWAAGKLAGWAIGLGMEPAPQVLLHPSVIERFIAHAPGLSGPARRTLRTNLRLTPGAQGHPAPGPGGQAAAPREGQGPVRPPGDQRVPGAGA